MGKNGLVEWVVFQEQLRKHHRLETMTFPKKKALQFHLHVATLQYVHTGAGFKSIELFIVGFGFPDDYNSIQKSEINELTTNARHWSFPKIFKLIF